MSHSAQPAEAGTASTSSTEVIRAMAPKITVPKFTGRGFKAFEMQFVAMLSLAGVDDWRDREPMTDEERGRELQAQNLLVTHIHSKFLPGLARKPSFSAKWKMLERHHASKSAATIQALTTKLMHLRIGDAKPLNHVTRFAEILTQLEDVGEEVTEALKITTFLTSVRDDYCQFAQTQASMALTTYEEVEEKFLAYATQFGRDGSEESTVKVHSANRRSEHNSKKQSSQRRKSSWKDKSKTECFDCKQLGHWRGDAKCPKKKIESEDSDDEEKTLTVATTRSVLTSSAAEMVGSATWGLDYQAFGHLTSSEDDFVSMRSLHPPVVIEGINGERFTAGKVGTKSVTFEGVDGPHTLLLTNCYYAPKASMNLVSGGALDGKGFSTTFSGGTASLHGPDGRLLFTIQKGNNNLYFFRESVVSKPSNVLQARKISEWHSSMGHVGRETLLKSIDRELISNPEHKIDCEICETAKSERLRFPPGGGRKPSRPLEIVATDLAGPVKPVTAGGNKYLLVVLDLFSHSVSVRLLGRKSEAGVALREELSRWETLTGHRVAIVRSDRGGEFTSKTVESFFHERGITHQVTLAATPQQNGAAESVNKVLFARVRAMLEESGAEQPFWGEAATYAAQLWNRTFSRAVNGVPNQIIDFFDNALPARPFGCLAWATVLPSDRRNAKLSPRARKCVFMGLTERSKGYRLWDLKESRMLESRDVTFRESSFPWKENGGGDLEKGGVRSDNDEMGEVQWESGELAQQESVATECDTGSTEYFSAQEEPQVQPVPGEEPQLVSEEEPLQEEPNELENALETRTRSGRLVRRPTRFVHSVRGRASDPKSVYDLEEHDERDDWIAACRTELNRMAEYQVFGPSVTLPVDRPCVSMRWVFETKLNAAGETVGRRARLVAKGYNQRPGHDYDKTFAPVVSQEARNIASSIAAAQRFMCAQLDVSVAFLNGDMDKEVYVEQVPGLEIITGERMVAGVGHKLQKAIYGTKQAARMWNTKLNSVISEVSKKNTTVGGRSYGVETRRLASDQCVYAFALVPPNQGRFLDMSSPDIDEKKTWRQAQMILIVHVDDMRVYYDENDLCQSLIVTLEGAFEIKKPDHCLFLGANSSVRRGQICLSMRTAVNSLLQETGLTACNPASTPMECGFSKKEEGERLAETEHEEYRKLVGSLLWIGSQGRPDIAFAVQQLSQAVEQPHCKHLVAAKRVVRYLKGTPELGLCWQGPQVLEVYADASWASERDRRSISGFVVLLNGSPIVWKAERQSIVAMSTQEAELIALTEATRSTIYCRRLVAELGFPVEGPTKLNEDNQGVIALVQSETPWSGRNKHIDLRFHFPRFHSKRGTVAIEYCPTEGQIADILTKPLTVDRHRMLVKKMGMKPVVSIATEEE